MLAAVITQGGAAKASPLAAQPPDVPDPMVTDAQSYAADFGVTLDEALRRLSLQRDVGELDADLMLNEVETFAGLWIQHEPEFRIIVKFTEGGEETIQPYIKDGELAGLVDTGTAETTLKDLRKAQLETISEVEKLGLAADSGINVFDNKVELYVVDKKEIESHLTTAGRVLPERVDVIKVSNLARPASKIYGGLALSECTSGFAVQDSQGTKGITTAAHCDDSLSYSGTALIHRGEIEGGSADVQWHTTPGFTVRNRIHVGYGETRDVTGTRHRDSQGVNAYVCKYGKITGYDCGRIVDKSYKPSWYCSDRRACYWSPTFIRVTPEDPTSLFVDLGDSGGPWFSGTTAWGTLVGWQSEDVDGIHVTDAIYMAINYLSQIGVSVLIE